MKQMIDKIIKEELSKKNRLNEGRKFISPRDIIVGEFYNAVDSSDDDPETAPSEKVKILLKKKDQSGEYNVSVKLPDGTIDKWYLSKFDTVFFK